MMMKKYLLLSILSVFGLTSVHAQYNDVEWGLFNHLSVGVGLGTTGISVDVAAPISPYVAVRGGADILPNIKFHPALDLGLQYWGTPKIYLEGDNGKTRLKESDLDPESGKGIKALSETKFWPVLNFRCVYRIFSN